MLVKHDLSAAIRARTARTLAGTATERIVTQALARSSALGAGVDRANVGPEHLNRRPSVNTNTQDLTGARRFARVATPEFTAMVATDEQLPELT